MTHYLSHPNVLSLDALLSKLAPLRAQGKRIVFTNGCFDIVHPGHVNLLESAKAAGDVLVLGLNSDASVRRLGKGAGRPFNSYEARAFVLAHLRAVDFVTVFNDDTPFALIEAIRPDVLVKGGDWAVGKIVGADIVSATGGTVLSLPLIEGFSTTSLAEKIRCACG